MSVGKQPELGEQPPFIGDNGNVVEFRLHPDVESPSGEHHEQLSLRGHINELARDPKFRLATVALLGTVVGLARRFVKSRGHNINENTD